MVSKADLITRAGKLASLSKAGPLKILMVSVEASPFSNVGGVARVVTYLSGTLHKLGHDVRIIVPRFDFIDEEKYPMEMVWEGFEVPTGDEKTPTVVCNIKSHTAPSGVPVYLVENMQFYEKRTRPYGYSDDAVRWALLCRAALEFVKHGEWVPDVIHAHDWHGGAIPDFLAKNYAEDERLQDVATLFTIHNIFFQGWHLNEIQNELDRDDGRSPPASFFSERIKKQNFMRRGVTYADAVNAVSETYAREILTAEHGEGLDRLLLEVRSKLFGIMNGLDYEEFNPETDRFIVSHFSADSLDKREPNKAALQKEFGLPQRKDVPLLGFVGRIDWQKGIDLIVEMLPHLLKDFDVQFVHVGGGDPAFVEQLQKIAKKFPDKIGLHPLPNFTLPRLVFSGADIMLFPSRFEPCGIVQLEALRYGAVPVVRATGGLADSVENYQASTDTGTGFVFQDFDQWSFYGQVVRAIETYRRKDVWQGLIKRAMSQDFSWGLSARKYVDLYRKAILFHQQSLAGDGALSPEIREGMV